MKSELVALSDRLLSGALTGFYQGIAVALLVALGLRLLRRTNAATRHAVWFTTLLLVTGLMVGNCLHAGFSFSTPPNTNAPETSLRALDGQALATDAGLESTGAADDLDWEDYSTSEPSQANPSVQNHFEVETTAPSTPVLHQQSASNSVAQTFLERAASRFGIGNVSPTILSATAPHPISWRSLAGLGLPPFCAAAVLGVLLLVACARMLVLSWHLYQLRRLKRGACAPSNTMQFIFRELCRRLAVKRPVELKFSSAIRSPVLLGFMKPVVLLPQPEPGPDDLVKTKQIICHELAHVRRRDDWLNLVQHSLEAAVFFQPVVWWISKQLSLEREIACDDLVLHQGGRPRAYALLLTELAGRLNGPRALIAPGVSASHSQLKQRINMILNTNRNISPCLALSRAGLLTSTAALLALAAFYFAPRLVLAQDAPEPPVPPTPPTPVVQPMQPALPPVAAVATAPAATSPADEPEEGPKYKSYKVAPAAPRAFSLAPATPGAFNFAPATPRPSGVAPVAPATAEVACDTTVGVAVAGPGHALAFPHPMAMAGHGSGGGGFGVSGGGGFGSSNGGDRSSVEERLDRLEKMVESLAAQQKAKPKSADMWFYSPDQMTLKRQAELSQERAEREVARAQEQMKRAAEEMERSAKDQELKAQMMAKDMPRKQLEALRRAREGLQRQMNALDRQIERLEQDGEKQKEPKEPKEPKEERGRRSEALPEQPGHKVVAGEVY
jgi:beta-lactamase regulating signal transducer with metallopeptidase domain